jgi:hypothetical protein
VVKNQWYDFSNHQIKLNIINEILAIDVLLDLVQCLELLNYFNK